MPIKRTVDITLYGKKAGKRLPGLETATPYTVEEERAIGERVFLAYEATRELATWDLIALADYQMMQSDAGGAYLAMRRGDNMAYNRIARYATVGFMRIKER